ncbi:MAG TPA: cytochrome c, partial [Rhizomicrobium sp.]|nr:cytochrome c [Rhizomicrobium sp.]
MNRITILLLGALCAVGAVSIASAQKAPAEPSALSAADTAQAIRDFNSTCAACHGDNGGGGDRAPALIDNAHLRTLDAAGIEGIIRNGQRAMPPFANLPPAEVARLAAWLHSLNISGLQSAPPEQVAAGEAYF